MAPLLPGEQQLRQGRARQAAGFVVVASVTLQGFAQRQADPLQAVTARTRGTGLKQFAQFPEEAVARLAQDATGAFQASPQVDQFVTQVERQEAIVPTPPLLLRQQVGVPRQAQQAVGHARRTSSPPAPAGAG